MHAPPPRRTLAALLGLLIAVAAVGSASAAAPKIVDIVGYSTLKAVYAAQIAAFTKTAAGRGVVFRQSYGASGAQATAVAMGQSADIVNLSLDPDMERLVAAGLVSPDYSRSAYHGYVTDSLVVFVVRKGNPRHIRTWQDLVRPGVGVLIPNPFLSGAARWDVMAAYGAALARGKTPAQAKAFLAQLYGHVVAQDASGASAMSDFLGGRGDVLVTYENEAIAAKAAGEPVSYVIPPQTIEIQAPIALVRASRNSAPARAFLAFLLSRQGQAIFARYGYRPVVPSVLSQYKARFPTPQRLFYIAAVGGWTQAMKTFFAPGSGVMAKIEASSGGAAR